MTERQRWLAEAANRQDALALEAERFLWEHPATGFTEWEADAYLAVRFEELGYELIRAGDIPGFYTEIRTGRPGPTLAIMGEMDALDLAGHPDAVNGMAHACGHHCQSAGMLALAAALREPGILDGLSGTLRLMLLPAEEMIQLEFREELRQKGIIHYYGGKTEFMYRGMFDGVDLAMMVHTMPGTDLDYYCEYGANGCMAKTMVYHGRSSHAGSAPEDGINAQYAASLGLQACNDLRETLRDQDMVRFHPILKGVTCAVNIIPDEMRIESYVRANSMEAIKRENAKFNRAMAGAALSMGAGLTIHDRPGYAPEFHDRTFMKLAEECCVALAGSDRVQFDYEYITGSSSDFGDLTSVMPGLQFYVGGAEGTRHGTDYRIRDAKLACLGAARAELLIMDELLKDGAAKAYEILQTYQPAYPSIQAYLEDISRITMDREAVRYQDDGTVTVDYQNSRS